ncbi:MAG: hypothetical protein ACLFQ7_16610 [Phormidium sp.]
MDKLNPIILWISLLLAILPGLAAMAIAVQVTSSGWFASLAILSVLLGIVVVAIAVLATAVSVINYLNSSFSQSQAYGFIFVPIILPFLLYSGSVSGAFLAMFFYRQGSGGLTLIPWLISRFLAVMITVGLTGFLLAFILSSSDKTTPKTTKIRFTETSVPPSTPQSPTTAIESVTKSTSLLWLQLGILIQGLASAWLGSSLSHGLFQILLNFRDFSCPNSY